MTRSSLARHIARDPMTGDEIRDRARAAWLMRGYLCLSLDQAMDDFERQFLTNIGNREYGVRK